MPAHTFADADTRSPWYEPFAPFKGLVASEPEAEPEALQADEAPDDDWAAEALFDCYND